MPRVLVVTGTYYPAVLADTHRARLLARELRELDWGVEVLAPNHEFQRPDSIERDAKRFFATDVCCHGVTPRFPLFFRLFNMRSIGWRALWPMYYAGARILSRKRFDLVYITTAQFNLFCLGRLWKRRFGIPYLIDLHDPWVRKAKYITTTHRIKFYMNAFLAHTMEKFAVSEAAGLVSVSSAYIDELRSRYPAAKCLHAGRAVTIPFGASREDLSVVRRDVKAPINFEVCYVGAGGTIMERSCRAIFEAFAAYRKQAGDGSVENVIFSFFGTEAFWRERDQKFIVSLAKQAGLEQFVVEHPPRVSYRRSLELIQSSAGLLVLGVDDPAYMPSKLFLYALTGKPLLACLHLRSEANAYFRKIPALGHVMHFGGDPGANLRAMRGFIADVIDGRTFDRSQLLGSYTSRSVACRHIELFERCLYN